MEPALPPARTPPPQYGAADYAVRGFLAVAGLDINNPDRAEELRDNLEWLDERRQQLAQEKVQHEARNQRQRDMR